MGLGGHGPAVSLWGPLLGGDERKSRGEGDPRLHSLCCTPVLRGGRRWPSCTGPAAGQATAAPASLWGPPAATDPSGLPHADRAFGRWWGLYSQPLSSVLSFNARVRTWERNAGLENIPATVPHERVLLGTVLFPLLGLDGPSSL